MRLFLLYLLCPVIVNGYLLDGLYCGTENCYDLLEVTRESTRQEISRNYRQLAKKYHPDTHRGETAKKEAEEVFKRVTRAYEVLRDEGSRADYNYMLDNPDEYYSHFYRYYRRRTKVDVRLVVLVCVTLISLVQYFSRKQRYEEAIKYFMTVPKYRNKALEMLNQSQSAPKKSAKSRISKSEMKEESEKNIRKIIEENLDIQGAYAKPQITDILWIQIIMLPYTIFNLTKWHVMWIYNFVILKKPYGEEEKLYLIRKNMKLGINQFRGIENDKINEYMCKELWIKEKYKLWKAEEDEEMKRQMADNPRYKAYRRYMKNRGPGRITFEE
ncbi:dnaJ homolog subfamily C member 25 homolog [Toxorhynchites rutilus septentrionalis]|uniref:dnaJ homolog subfamily C member 25 homolog n=1 Tax=Toxorhynchites rutilus septentrionalis TaxID=329112 RepID=UPI002478A19B|nr:dnaJ homolog subfamily C member 25 homolog [Toxorhynchites rutilus septentrionalis]